MNKLPAATAAVEAILGGICGHGPEAAAELVGLDRQNTHACFAETMSVMFGGYGADLGAVLGGLIASGSYAAPVVVRDIAMISTCEHHLLPFFGTVDIAYCPGKGLVGIGGVLNLVKALSRRLQIQERLTVQIGEALDAHLRPAGVAVRIKARHLCAEVGCGAMADVVTCYASGVLKGQGRSDVFWGNGEPA